MKTKVIGIFVFGALSGGFLAIAFDWLSSPTDHHSSAQPEKSKTLTADAPFERSLTHEDAPEGAASLCGAGCVERGVVRTDGTKLLAWDCPKQNTQRHPYADLDEAVLTDMAYRDPEAAEILAMRLFEEGEKEKGLDYVYRSIALTAGRSFRAFNRVYNTYLNQTSEELDGPQNFDGLEKRYVYFKIRDLLAGTSMFTHDAREMIEYGYEGDFFELDQQAKEIMSRMAAIETEVVGSRRFQRLLEEDSEV